VPRENGLEQRDVVWLNGAARSSKRDDVSALRGVVLLNGDDGRVLLATCPLLRAVVLVLRAGALVCGDDGCVLRQSVLLHRDVLEGLRASCAMTRRGKLAERAGFEAVQASAVVAPSLECRALTPPAPPATGADTALNGDDLDRSLDHRGGPPQRGADPVEAALAAALDRASADGRYDVVIQLARELEARRTARAGNVVRLEDERREPGR
jgi:hypothetical protein